MLTKMIADADVLIERLEYFKNYIKNIPIPDEFKAANSFNIVHTDIVLLSGKLKYK